MSQMKGEGSNPQVADEPLVLKGQKAENYYRHERHPAFDPANSLKRNVAGPRSI